MTTTEDTADLTGKLTLTVNTAHSRYVINQASQTYARYRVHRDANDLTDFGVGHGVAVDYRDILMPGVGERMTIVHPDGSWVVSTPVQSVVEGAE